MQIWELHVWLCELTQTDAAAVKDTRGRFLDPYGGVRGGMTFVTISLKGTEFQYF